MSRKPCTPVPSSPFTLESRRCYPQRQGLLPGFLACRPGDSAGRGVCGVATALTLVLGIGVVAGAMQSSPAEFPGKEKRSRTETQANQNVNDAVTPSAPPGAPLRLQLVGVRPRTT
jgi:hypothetical protein